jgi:hypothetical protein
MAALATCGDAVIVMASTAEIEELMGGGGHAT